MLTELWVSNFAVMKDVRAPFRSGLNALTGETGAGKSLVVGALDLALGARASSDLVRRGEDEAQIVARFDLPPDHFTARGLDEPLPEGTLVLRRVIAADGRSRAYVNDRPATVNRLRELGGALADLHGQHEQQNLLREETHLDYLDAFGDHAEGAVRVAADHAALAAAREAREAFLAGLRRSQEEMEILRYQFQELEAADLREGETEELESERHVAAHAGRLAESVGDASAALADGDPGGAELLGRAARLLGQAASHDGSLEPLRRQLDEVTVAAEEIARELAAYLDRLNADPARLEEIESRLDLLTRLGRKYRLDEAGLIARREELRRALNEVEDAPTAMAGLDRDVERAEEALRGSSAALTAARNRAAASLARAVSRELKGLGMEGANFTVALAPPKQGLPLPGRPHPVGSRGAEEAAFALAANRGERGGPLAKIASGGEISRVMLALKNVLRRVDPVPVVIFDEVDAGIGGLVAERVAGTLEAIARERQVLVVTHLAVIAGRASHHLKLAKRTVDRRTVIEIEPLEGRPREEELARMLAGSLGGKDALRTARTLLSGRDGR
jgi:DNA repair protein RecN (Recombination protein N)